MLFLSGRWLPDRSLETVRLLGSKAFRVNQSANYRVASPPLLSQDFVHGLAFNNLVHELVQNANFAHHWVLDFFNHDATDSPCDLAGLRVGPWCLLKESLDILLEHDLVLQLLRGVARQPANRLVHVGLLT